MRYSLLFFILISASCTTAQDTGQYCNEAYAFCLDYPGGQLTLQSAEEAFATFASADNALQLTVKGYEKPEGWSLEDIYYMTFEDKLRRNPDLEIVNETFGKQGFELLYQENEQLHYHQVYMNKGTYVQLSLFLPKAQKQRFEALKAELELSFEQ
ncbi:MAG: hypothetical protein GVY26_11040 [Bacteroidetes bacterium]|jgi:hypothetical protein|nr:hypothetical protein [Bacteroidota bacterium]